MARREMRYGFQCEDCEVAVFPTTTRSELAWLRDRVHVVREVAKHSSTGLDTWMMEGLAFLDEHQGHSIVVVSRR
jgi:methionyl-tRNA synthetase